MPGGFVEGVHSEAGPDVGGDGVGLGLGEAGGEFDVAMGEEVIDVGLGEDWGVFVLGRHVGGCLWLVVGLGGVGWRCLLPVLDWRCYLARLLVVVIYLYW